ncbi:MAG: transposase [Deltaproteobacteria bacterium]|nr:transposase [Deltaproteobacteria bacterium]
MERATVYRHRLPHWRVHKAAYFVTWRLHSLQRDLAPAERTAVLNAIKYFEGERYDLIAYVVMNDHVHVLFSPVESRRVQDLIHTWKSFTANALQRTGRVGSVWQDEYFDRVMRNDEELLEKANYIVANPWKRWPDGADYEWVGIRGNSEP